MSTLAGKVTTALLSSYTSIELVELDNGEVRLRIEQPSSDSVVFYDRKEIETLALMLVPFLPRMDMKESK